MIRRIAGLAVTLSISMAAVASAWVNSAAPAIVVWSVAETATSQHRTRIISTDCRFMERPQPQGMRLITDFSLLRLVSIRWRN